MAATPDMIPADLTMELGDDPSPSRFMSAATHFFGYIAEISKQVAPPDAVPQWVVRVREGSDLLALAPAAEAESLPWLEPIYAQAAKGVLTLIQGGIDAAALPEPALNHLNKLSELTRGPKERPMFIRLWFKRNPILVDATIAEIVREDERQGYNDFGTVEGIMDTIKDKDGLQFRVRDDVLALAIKCLIAEEQLKQAFDAFRKRVEVSGVIRYNRKGIPRSIRAERIEQLPNDDDLPSPEDVKGILRIA